jgi:hypothetical protein
MYPPNLVPKKLTICLKTHKRFINYTKSPKFHKIPPVFPQKLASNKASGFNLVIIFLRFALRPPVSERFSSVRFAIVERYISAGSTKVAENKNKFRRRKKDEKIGKKGIINECCLKIEVCRSGWTWKEFISNTSNCGKCRKTESLRVEKQMSVNICRFLGGKR